LLEVQGRLGSEGSIARDYYSDEKWDMSAEIRTA
jgi:hypothetical protein